MITLIIACSAWHTCGTGRDARKRGYNKRAWGLLAHGHYSSTAARTGAANRPEPGNKAEQSRHVACPENAARCSASGVRANGRFTRFLDNRSTGFPLLVLRLRRNQRLEFQRQFRPLVRHQVPTGKLIPNHPGYPDGAAGRAGYLTIVARPRGKKGDRPI